MNKIVIIILLLALILNLVSCNDEEKPPMFNLHDVSFECSYDVEVLLDYFENGTVLEALTNADVVPYHYYEVNESFPLEYVNPEGYSVYSVNQGGFFYVFWSNFNLTSQDIASVDPTVYFTSYINSTQTLSLFSSLIVESSTVEDVLKLDPYAEIVLSRSQGIFTYSFLDSDLLLEIEYSIKSDDSGNAVWVVKKISTISRMLPISRYSTILHEDLPVKSIVHNK